MAKHIVIIQGHPDSAKGHLCHALAEAYARGAADSGHTVQTIEIADLDFPLLHTKHAFEHEGVPPALAPCLEAIGAADHLVIVYPLWLGEMPALLKGFFEHIFRPGFAFDYGSKGFPIQRLKSKSARIVVTMGMPALVYRWYFAAHGLKSLKRNILAFAGIGPIRDTLFGMVENVSAKRRGNWLARMETLGRKAV